jgi:hypothetical protein
VDGTSAPERDRTARRFGTIVVIGGGCYGRYFLRQLGRAARAGALTADQVLVVDRNPDCAVATDPPADGAAVPWRLVTAGWREWFAAELRGLDPRTDAIVPSPLMPHLAVDWLLDRARARWPGRAVDIDPLPASIGVTPWERAAPDGRQYVSFATWTCPVNCIEPARCPHTRAARDWSLPPAIRGWAAERPEQFRAALLLPCTHRAWGVGMIDAADFHAADAALAREGALRGGVFLVATLSHCHGAVTALRVGASGVHPPDGGGA